MNDQGEAHRNYRSHSTFCRGGFTGGFSDTFGCDWPGARMGLCLLAVGEFDGNLSRGLALLLAGVGEHGVFLAVGAGMGVPPAGLAALLMTMVFIVVGAVLLGGFAESKTPLSILFSSCTSSVLDVG